MTSLQAIGGYIRITVRKIITDESTNRNLSPLDVC